MTPLLRLLAVAMLALACSSPSLASDPLAAYKRACPGLTTFKDDLSPVTTSRSALSGYEGGTELDFTVSEKPTHLPAQIRVLAAGHFCAVAINKEKSCAYSSKRACRAICTGTWPKDINERETPLRPGGCDAKAAPESDTKIERLNATALTRGLPLYGRKMGQSDNGRKKQSWQISGFDTGATFEIIGNDQDDADVVAWHCAQYDDNGNRKPAAPGSKCFVFFKRVLQGIFTSPDSIATELLARSGSEGTTVSADYGDLRVETDGEFYFIRRISRQ